MEKDTYFFSHDFNARNDPKILELRSVYGMEGYGRYWVLIEMMREQSDYKIMLTQYVWNALAMQMQCDADAAKQFALDCINLFHLFESDGDAFWSNSLRKRMHAFDTKSNKRSEAAKKAAEARWNKASEVSSKGKKKQEKMQSQCVENANASNVLCDSMPRKENNNIYTTTSTIPPIIPQEKNEPEKCQGDDLQEVYTLYSNNIHPISGEIEADKLEDAVKTYGAGWVKRAIERAVMRPNGRSIGYVLGILRRWENNGFDVGEETNADGKSSESAGVIYKPRKKNAAGRKETDWNGEPEGLPAI